MGVSAGLCGKIVGATLESLTWDAIVKTRCHGPRGMWGQPTISDAEHLV
jgi:hypothetical protein